jgi:hypothetical protein
LAILLETAIDAKFTVPIPIDRPNTQQSSKKPDAVLFFPRTQAVIPSHMAHMKPRQKPDFAPNRRKALLAAVFILLGYIGIISHSIGMDYEHADDCHICLQIHIQGHGLAPNHSLLQPPAFNQPAIPRETVYRLADFYSSARSRAPPVL